MRIEGAGARTWLLAAVALWAVCTWVLAAAGLGGKIRPLPADPSLLQPLPGGSVPEARPLEPLAGYPAVAGRPLFAHDRRLRPFFLEQPPESDDKADDFDVVLVSVLLTPGLEMAIVQPRNGGEAVRFKVGEPSPQRPGWTLASVEPRSAVFVGPQGERTFQLRVFDGVGGQPPTRAVAGNGPPPPAAPAEPDARDGRPDGRLPPAGPDGVLAREDALSAGEDRRSQAESIRARIEARRAALRDDP